MTPRVAWAIATWQPPGRRKRHLSWTEIDNAWIVLHALVMAAAEEDRKARS